jgi:ABC-2 type transport system permease protein
MNLRRVYSVIRKEWWHITRDPTSFVLLLLSPVLVLITMGYAFSIDIENVTVAIMDQDLTPTSREFFRHLSSTVALQFDEFPGNMDQVESILMHGDAKAVVIIPSGFEEDFTRGTGAQIQVLVDGTDPNTAGHAIRHITAQSQRFTQEIVGEQLMRIGLIGGIEEPIELSIRAWYNPYLRYTVSMIPALVGVVLSVPAMAASLALAREREWGTLEGLIATPIRRAELMIGKLIPYLLAGLLSVPLCIATAVYGFTVPFQGSLLLYMALAVIFLFATMSIALFLSVLVKSQQAAIMGSMMIFLFSGFFMSGLLIPFSLMGPIIKLEAFMMPTTHFVIISRGLFTKGATLGQLQGYVLALVGIGILFLALTVLFFKKKL